MAQLDLTTRLMRYPLSYMIYSPAFDGLASEVKTAVYERLFTRLAGGDAGPRYAHLRTPQARAAAEILRDTKADLPPQFRPRRTAGAGR